MPISRYIFVAASEALLGLLRPARSPVELGEAEVAVGGKRAHAEPGAKLEGASESILGCVCGVGSAAKQPPSRCFVATLTERNRGPERALRAGPRLRHVTD